MTLFRYVKKAASILGIFSLISMGGSSWAQEAPEGNYFPVEIANSSQIAKDNLVYIMIKAINPQTKEHCFIKFLADGTGFYADVKEGDKALDYSYPLTSFPLVDGKRKLYIPQVESGRMYISLGNTMEIYPVKNANGVLTIPDPDGFNPQDANYYTLYDKVEFSYTSGGVWINPTAVDFFSLPIQVVMPTSQSGFTKSGLSDSRSDIFTQLINTFAANDTTNDKIWSDLFLQYENTPTFLRIMSPGKAMAPVPDTQPFDPNYLNNEQKYGFNYIDFLWNYYTVSTLVIDASELQSVFPLDNYIFTGQVVGDNFVFTNDTGSYTVSIAKPTGSVPFFAGAQPPFDAANNTPKAIIVRELTSAFDVGLVPAPDATILNKDYFTVSKTLFYKKNPALPEVAQGPWYDLYSKALHGFGEDQPIYTFAYDDALGQDGTLHDPNAESLGTATITIGDMRGTEIPDPYSDKTVYTIVPILGKNTTVTYNDEPIENNQPIPDVKMPFVVNVNGTEAEIYVKDKIVRPVVSGTTGIVITPSGKDQATITFPAKAE